MTPDFRRPPAPFIVGVARSGTTLLRLMLDAHPDLCIPGETHFLPQLLWLEQQSAGREDVVSLMTSSMAWPNFGITTEALREAIFRIEPFSLADAVRAFYGLYAARHGKTRWGDKTPTYRRFITGIQALLPEAHFIHIIRDGRDVALSFRGMWFGPGDGIEEQASSWVDHITATRRQAVDVPHYLEVRYEDLIAETRQVLEQICVFLEMPFSADMLGYHLAAATRLREQTAPLGPPGRAPETIEEFLAIHSKTSSPPDSSRVQRWKTEMSRDEQRRYEAVASPLLQSMGYETAFN